MPAILNSWKEIAMYLDPSVRAVRRWQSDMDLPIRRVRRGKRAPVFAFANEIDDWLRKQHDATKDGGRVTALRSDIRKRLTASRGASCFCDAARFPQ